MELFLFAVLGFIAGAVARWFVPGQQNPVGVLATVALGTAGSLLGGLVSWVWWPPGDGQWHPAGILMSMLGALAVLLPYSVYARRSRP
jgi:uncharacterized membrane protein YeaQ/YmgE (transglycosylase-associated protein family)